MKVHWDTSLGFPVARVTHQVPKEVLATLPRLEELLAASHELKTSKNVLAAFARSFVKGSDVRGVEISGTSITCSAICPASAWLFNNHFAAMLKVFSSQPSLLANDMYRIIQNHGFQLRDTPIKENGFLEAARRAGLDVIRSSPTFQSYTVRDLSGKSISVMRQFTDRTSHIATKTTTDKLCAADTLALAGIPTPKTLHAPTARHAVELFKRENFAMGVIKPRYTDRGLGVYTGLKTEMEVSTAFESAHKYGQVILQKHVDGEDFRILVVDGEVLGVTQRSPFMIVGDGKTSVRDLITKKIEWRSRHPFYRNFNDISPDNLEIKTMLGMQKLDYDSILDRERIIRLRSSANVSSGGEHTDVTMQCHDDVKELALECASLFGLDVAGVDYLSSDITKSWRKTNGVVCEVNPTPAFSVNGVPEKVFSRLSVTSSEPSDPRPSGDMLYVKDCSCRSLEDVATKFCDFNIQDMSKISEIQYFFQSFLLKRSGRFLYVAPLALLKKNGIVNANVRKILACNKCSADVHQATNNISGAYAFDIEFI